MTRFVVFEFDEFFARKATAHSSAVREATDGRKAVNSDDEKT